MMADPREQQSARPADDAVNVAPAGVPSRVRRSIELIAVAAPVMLVCDYVASASVMLALLGRPVAMVGIPVAAVGLTAALVGLSRALLGRRSILGSASVTLLLAAIGAYGFASGILSPLGWGTDVPLHLLVCSLCAIALGAFLPPWQLRVVGIAATVAVVALIASIPTSAAIAEAERLEREAQQRQDSIEHLLERGARPVVTELEGWSHPRIHPTGDWATTWARNSAGAVATILVAADDGRPVVGDWCHYLTRPGDAAPAGPDASPEWCVPTDTGWTRSDGTATVFHDADRLIAIRPADQNIAAQAGGTRSATAADIAALAGSLRPMSDSELERYVLPVYDGDMTPVIDTPGL